jgi:uncharacterized Zn finger protein
MDTGEGKFKFAESLEKMKELEDQYPDHGGWFRVGEIVELNGSRFRVKAVKPTQIILKLLPKGRDHG